jgi:hypothetical protein
LTIASILLVVFNNVLQLKFVLYEATRYSLAFPLSGALLLVAFVSSIVRSKEADIIKWRDRTYSIRIKDKTKQT